MASAIDWGEMRPHPYADIFPLIGAAELRELADDVKDRKLLHPIVRFEGQILDGRNRYLACRMAGVPARFEDFHGTAEEALALVVSENVKRRHLTTAQRAEIAPKVHAAAEENARKRQEASRAENRKRDANGRVVPASAILRAPVPDPRKAAADTAKVLGISPRTVESALAVDKKGTPELKAAVKEGKVSISAAAEIATAPPARQKEVVRQEQAEILRAAKEIKKERAAERQQKQETARAGAAWTKSEESRRALVEKGKTVVANMKTDLALVGWATKAGLFVQIDRQTDWGNPFNLGPDGDRGYVCESFAIYLKRKPSILKRLPELRGKVLGCWCHPEECHGERLVDAL